MGSPDGQSSDFRTQNNKMMANARISREMGDGSGRWVATHATASSLGKRLVATEGSDRYRPVPSSCNLPTQLQQFWPPASAQGIRTLSS